MSLLRAGMHNITKEDKDAFELRKRIVTDNSITSYLYTLEFLRSMLHHTEMEVEKLNFMRTRDPEYSGAVQLSCSYRHDILELIRCIEDKVRERNEIHQTS